MKRLTYGLLLFLFVALAAAPTAMAQDEPLIGGEEPPPPPPPQPQPQPQPQPPQPQPQPQPGYQPQPQPQPPPSAAGEMTPRKQKDVTDTDHDMVIKAIGLQIVYLSNIGSIVGGGSTSSTLKEGEGSDTSAIIDAASGASQAQMGIRTWFTRGVGLDAGLSIYIAKPPMQDAETQVGFGLYAGVPFALGVYRHIVMFAGPDVGFALFHVAEKTNPWLFQLKGKAGIEVSLGFIDIPRLSLIGTFEFGLRVFNTGAPDNAQTEIVVGNGHGFSFRSLFESSVGLVFYI